MTTHQTDTCTICLRKGHNAGQWKADQWPRWVGRWLVLFVLSMTFGAVLYGMGIT